MIELIPAILAKDKGDFLQKVRAVSAVAPLIHIDILDGSLFDASCWFKPEEIKEELGSIGIELHLMVADPLLVVRKADLHLPRLKRAIVHAEIKDLQGTISMIRGMNDIDLGIALNPETDSEFPGSLLIAGEELLIMGVHPGASGQAFLGESVLQKIRDAHARYPELNIGADGGIAKDLIQSVVHAGATRICAASALFKTPNPAQAYLDLSAICTSNAAVL